MRSHGQWKRITILCIRQIDAAANCHTGRQASQRCYAEPQTRKPSVTILNSAISPASRALVFEARKKKLGIARALAGYSAVQNQQKCCRAEPTCEGVLRDCVNKRRGQGEGKVNFCSRKSSSEPLSAILCRSTLKTDPGNPD